MDNASVSERGARAVQPEAVNAGGRVERSAPNRGSFGRVSGGVMGITVRELLELAGREDVRVQDVRGAR